MSRSNVAQSVRDRLLHRKRETGENYEALLTRFAIERLLYRLGQSDLREQFVAAEEKPGFDQKWLPGGPWTQK
jgi:hypothetical protein